MDRLNKTKLFPAIVFIAGISFMLFIIYYENLTRSRQQAQLDISSEVIAESVWTLFMPASKSYIDHISRDHQYKKVTVSSKTGAILLQVTTELDGPLDKILYSVNLIRTNTLNSKIFYEGKHIGDIHVEAFNFALYFYLYILVLLALLLMMLWLFLKLYHARQELEQRVFERTANLTESNQKYELEIQ